MYSETEIDLYFNALHKFSREYSRPLKGASDAQIAELEASLPGPLPYVLRASLKAMGVDNGVIWLGSDFGFPKILKMRTWAKECLEDDGYPHPLPDCAIVFFFSQGCAFSWLPFDKGIDPPVWSYAGPGYGMWEEYPSLLLALDHEVVTHSRMETGEGASLMWVIRR